MIEGRRLRQSVAWAWAAGWFLASSGFVISDVYSRPNRGLTAAYLLGFSGWAVGAASTIRYVRQRVGADVQVVALSVAGWGVGAFVAVVFGLKWLEEWSPGFLGPVVAAAIGGVIGGALTLPNPSLSAPATMLRTSLSGAIRWGAAFLALKFLAFYAGYILVEMTVDPLVPMVGHIAAKIPGWAFPASLGGFLAARWAIADPDRF